MAGPSDETSLRTEGVRHRRYTRTRCNCDRLLRRKHRRFDMGDQLATHEPHHNLRKQTWMVSPPTSLSQVPQLIEDTGYRCVT
jgi:hypothetical protein